MSELYGITYRDTARPEAISATKLLGQVMLLVAIALAACLGTIALSHGTEDDAIWIATAIFVSIVNIFVSLLNIFSSR